MAGSKRSEVLLPSDEHKAGLLGEHHTPTPMLTPNTTFLDQIDTIFPIDYPLNKKKSLHTALNSSLFT